MGVVSPIGRPDVLAVVKKDKAHRPRPAPALTTEFAIALEKKANDLASPRGIRLYAALFPLLTLTSLHFADIRFVEDIWLTNAALRGISCNSKGENGALMNWATPLAGLSTPITEWYKPLFKHCDHVRSETGQLHPLSPNVHTGWEIDLYRGATFAVAQSRLPYMECVLGSQNQPINTRFETGPLRARTNCGFRTNTGED